MMVLYLKPLLGPTPFVGVTERHWFKSHGPGTVRGGLGRGLSVCWVYDTWTRTYMRGIDSSTSKQKGIFSFEIFTRQRKSSFLIIHIKQTCQSLISALYPRHMKTQTSDDVLPLQNEKSNLFQCSHDFLVEPVSTYCFTCLLLALSLGIIGKRILKCTAQRH